MLATAFACTHTQMQVKNACASVAQCCTGFPGNHSTRDEVSVPERVDGNSLPWPRPVEEPKITGKLTATQTHTISHAWKRTSSNHRKLFLLYQWSKRMFLQHRTVADIPKVTFLFSITINYETEMLALLAFAGKCKSTNTASIALSTLAMQNTTQIRTTNLQQHRFQTHLPVVTKNTTDPAGSY